MPLLRSFFIALSHNRPLRRFSERSRLGVRVSSRFIAGMEIDDALRVAEEVNKQGMSVTLDSLGESVTTEAEARAAAEVYHKLLDEIAARKLKANISIKLTQMGLNLSPALAESIADSVAQHAKATGGFVRIDMEDSSLTQVTIEIVKRLHAKPELSGAIGIVIQAYLFRSQKDIEELIANGVRVRLCKGAYQETAEIAFPRKADVDANFIKLANCCWRARSITVSRRTTTRWSPRPSATPASTASITNILSSRCSMESAVTCSASSSRRVTTCEYMSPSATTGTPTSCGGWPSGQRM